MMGKDSGLGLMGGGMASLDPTALIAQRQIEIAGKVDDCIRGIGELRVLMERVQTKVGCDEVHDRLDFHMEKMDRIANAAAEGVKVLLDMKTEADQKAAERDAQAQAATASMRTRWSDRKFVLVTIIVSAAVSTACTTAANTALRLWGPARAPEVVVQAAQPAPASHADLDALVVTP